MSVLLQPWIWRMAWRDSRSGRRRLLLYVLSIVAGVSALVATASFEANLRAAIDERAKTLLGADLSFSAGAPFTPAAEQLVASVAGRRARQVEFPSMAYFPGADASRLVSVRALEGDFPFYGELETEPAAAAAAFQAGPSALVEENLLLQYGAQVGDEIRLGTMTFRVAGRLQQVAGELPTLALISPRVYIPLRYLEQTGLIQPGSRARYTTFVALDDGEPVATVLERLRPALRSLPQRLGLETVERRRRGLGNALSNLTEFLGLVGFVALLLGCIGVASSIHLYVSQKVPIVAVLRCLGCSARQALAVFLLQTAGMGVVGAVAGAALGVVIQALLPDVLRAFLPTEIPFFVSWTALLGGLATGTVMAVLFGLMPLVAIRRVSPLLALRDLGEERRVAGRDRLRWLLGSLIVLVSCTFMVLRSPSVRFGFWMFGGVALVFVLLFGIARLVMRMARTLPPASWRYEMRQGLANLHRPHNQTAVLLLSLGLGTFLILTLFLTQGTLIAKVDNVIQENEVNLVVWDIQSDQLEGVRELFRSFSVPILRDLPVVAMRLKQVDGEAVEDLLERRRSRWALRWDYHATYRDHLIASEQLVEGEFVGHVGPGVAPVPVSLDVQVAEDLNVGIGDDLLFDIQGVPVPVIVGSLRRVNWEEDPPNFLVVFPAGVLEPAPQFHVVVGQVDSNEVSAALQRRLVDGFPNASIVDLELVMQTVNDVLDEIAFVIRFMGLFSVVTGLIVLSAAVITSRYQRMREGVLLRTLGASRKQILHIMLAEYVFLGTLAALTGMALSVAAAWMLSRFLFDVEFSFRPAALIAGAISVTLLTVVVGTLNSRGVTTRPPLEVLRNEVG